MIRPKVDMTNVKVTETQQRLMDLGIITMLTPCITAMGDSAPDCHLFDIDYEKRKELCVDVTRPSEDWTFSCWKVRGEDVYFTTVISAGHPGSYVN